MGNIIRRRLAKMKTGLLKRLMKSRSLWQDYVRKKRLKAQIAKQMQRGTLLQIRSYRLSENIVINQKMSLNKLLKIQFIRNNIKVMGNLF